jgi:hypothetical protein
MAELFPADADLESLSGLIEPTTGVYYPVKGEGLDWYVSFVKCIYRLVSNVSVAGGLRVYKVASIACGVKPGKFFDGTTLRDYAGTAEEVLTDNSTNYIYLLADGTLTINTTGFPNPVQTRHLRLAQIDVSDGSFSHDDITDLRTAHLWQLGGPVTAIADDAVDTAQLHDNVADLVPKVTISVGQESGNTIAVTIQVQDCQGNNNANRFLGHAWLSNSQYGSETSTAPSGTVSWTSGTQLAEITAKKRWSVITNSSGQAVLSIGESGSATWYLNVEIDGRVYAGSAITFAV